MITDYLRDTYKVSNGLQEIRPRIKCKDGFSMSVQAGRHFFCNPRCNLENGKYSAIEIGFPSEPEELIKEYAEDEKDYTQTVYGYVPVDIVGKVIEKHGGIPLLE